MPTSVARVTNIVPRVAVASRASTRRANGAVASRRAIPRAVAFACPTAARRCETSRGTASASSLPPARAPRAFPASIARPAPRSAPRLTPRDAPARGDAVRARAFGEGLATVTWPLVQPTDPWGVWAAILCASSFGLWGNKQRWGARVGGASLLSTLLALFLSNVGVIPTAAPAYTDVTKFLLPLAVPLLLLTADLRRVVTCTGRVLWCFFLGSVGTILGSILVRPTRSEKRRPKDGRNHPTPPRIKTLDPPRPPTASPLLDPERALSPPLLDPELSPPLLVSLRRTRSSR